MIRRESGRIVVSGPVTLANVAAVLEEGRRHLEEGVRTVDLGEVTEMDSSLLAAMIAWLRDARRRQRELAFINLPESLRTIARLYGLDGLIPVRETLREPAASR
jgi:phospholipid transport system transporter-binding protein